jgi:peptidoglycan/xylan/chitin deacetylase (PgdA/CDA1 family)
MVVHENSRRRRLGQYPTYLDLVVPRFLKVLHERDLKMTVFVVGQDAAREENFEALASISAAGHEIGNHSFNHEPWLHLYSEQELVSEFAKTEEHLERVTGQCPIGFRGPGFSFCDLLLKIMIRRGYKYDCSTFPTYLGPLARMYYFMSTRLTERTASRTKTALRKIQRRFPTTETI